MRRAWGAAFATGLGVLLAAAPAGAATKPVTGTSAGFADSVGVNIHEFYPDTAYLDKARLKGFLVELGVKHVRDGVRLDREDYVTEYPSARDIAAAGIKFLWITGRPGEPPSAAEAIDVLTDPQRLGGTTEALEGPNEYDEFRQPNAAGKDPLWAAALYYFMNDRYRAFKNDARFSAMPFWGPSFRSGGGRDEYAGMPGSGQSMDAPNSHGYPGGQPPEGPVAADINTYYNAFGQRKPAVTETGYHTATNIRSGHYGVSERAQSIYTARTLLTAFEAGAPRTYLYQLLDQKPEPALSNMEEHFGLVAVEGTGGDPFAWTLRKKAAFETVKEILDITRDTGADARPPTLDYSLSGAPAGLKQVLLSRSGGVVDLVLWKPDAVYSPTAGDLFPADTPVTLQLGERADVSIERPHSQRDFTALGRGTSFTVNVGADPVFVRIKGSRYAAEVRNDRPSAWLRLSETSGPPVDSAGAGATTDPWTAAPAYGAASAVGDVDDRSVTVAADQRSAVQVTPAVSTGAGSTIELWVKPGTGVPDFSHFLTAGHGDWKVAMRTYNQLAGAWRGSVYGARFGGEMVFPGFDPGAWHHVVLTMAGGVSTTYLDGRKVGEDGGGETLTLSRFTFGSRAGANAFAGSLDEVAVYPSALSAARVCAHYRAAGGTC